MNGGTVRSPEFKIDPEKDEVSLSGENIGYKKHLYIMLNKPAGVVTATRDGLSETVMELLPPQLRRQGLFPAGRLDKDTLGFVLITDDGELAHRILSPKSHVPKTYLVRLKEPISPDTGKIFAEGVDIGEVCRPAELKILGERECELTVHEGKYHQIKRMFSAVGNEVVYLERLSISGVKLDENLERGQARELTEDEIKRL